MTVESYLQKILIFRLWCSADPNQNCYHKRQIPSHHLKLSTLEITILSGDQSMHEDEVPNNLLQILCQKQWELDVSSWLDGLIGHFVFLQGIHSLHSSPRHHLPSPSSFLSFLLYESRYSIFNFLFFYFFYFIYFQIRTSSIITT